MWPGSGKASQVHANRPFVKSHTRTAHAYYVGLVPRRSDRVSTTGTIWNHPPWPAVYCVVPGKCSGSSYSVRTAVFTLEGTPAIDYLGGAIKAAAAVPAFVITDAYVERMRATRKFSLPTVCARDQRSRFKKSPRRSKRFVLRFDSRAARDSGGARNLRPFVAADRLRGRI